MIIQRDVRVEEALKKQAKEYKAKIDGSDEAVAIISARADGETRRAKVAHEKCVSLERDVSRSLERIARFELVVSEKTALVGELTVGSRTTRTGRGRGEAAETPCDVHRRRHFALSDGSHQTDDACYVRDGARRPRRGAPAPAAAERRQHRGRPSNND